MRNIGYWPGEIGADQANGNAVVSIPRQYLGKPPIVPAIPTRMGGGFEAASAIGLGVVAFGAAGVAIVLAAVAQAWMRPRRLVLEFVESGVVAPGLLTVTDVRIGTQSLLAGVAGVPIGAFAPDSVGPQLIGMPLSPGLTITVNIARTAAPGGATDVLVSGVLFGEAV